MKLIATKKHTREFQNVITLKAGDVVKIDLTRGSHWLGEVYCTLSDGSSGWVSKQAFESLEGQQATVEQDYSSVELETEIGDILEGYANTYTTTWCSNAQGQSGWVSDDCLEEDKIERNMRMTELIAKIEFSYADVEKGEGTGFREACQFDATYTFDEVAHQRIFLAREQDTEHWKELSDSFLRDHYVSIANCIFCWSNEKGFHYMLPSLMRFSLKQYMIGESLYAEWLITDISHFVRYPEFLLLLSFDQIDALAQYCELMLDLGFYSSSASPIWHRNYTKSLFERVGKSLSQEWFKAPI